MTVIKFCTFYKKQYEATLCCTEYLIYMVHILIDDMTFPSSGVVIHNFAKFLGIADLAQV